MLPNPWRWIVFSVACLCKFPTSRASDIKTWITNTNFLNPRNWEHDQLPCANDRVIFPESTPIITYMPETFAASELILPVDGELIFPENAVLELTGGKRPGACTGKDVRFKTTIDYWSEPINWNITSDSAFPRIPNRRNAAVPHAFQVPCPTDKVRFPAGTTFQVHINLPSASMSSLEINDVLYSQNEFDDLLRTGVGALLFPNEPSVRISSRPCTDETGCTCGNDRPEILSTICMFVTPYCPALECSDPIKPVGSCCPICGARIAMTYERQFTMKQLLNVHEHFLSKAVFEGVESFTSKTHEGTIQSVFVDGGKNKGLAGNAAETIHAALLSDIKGGRQYKILTAEMQLSKKWEAGVPTYDQHKSSGMSSGGVVAVIIILLILLGLGAAFYVYRKRQIPGFNFARFDLRADKIELELGTTPHDELQPVDPPVASSSGEEEKSKGFDNPVYGTTVEEVSPAITEESTEIKDFVENPMFTFFEDSAKPSEEEK